MKFWTTRIILISFFALSFGRYLPAKAQTNVVTNLFSIDTSAYPRITALLEVYKDGAFVSDLTAADLTVLENNTPLQTDDVEIQTLPLRIAIAVDPGTGMDVRDSAGRTRYEKARDALVAWGQTRRDNQTDTLSFSTTAGSLISEGNMQAWLNNFSIYTPPTRGAVPSLQSLVLAFKALEEQPAPPQENSAILFLTPHISAYNEAVINDLIARAAPLRVRVFIWYIDSAAYENQLSAQGLRLLANATGGEFVLYTGLEELPDPEIYFGNLRRIYKIIYTSRVQQTGSHSLAVSIQRPEALAITPQQTFDLTILPPNPILLDPPQEITRQTPENVLEVGAMEPTTQKIKIIIEFPDKHPRELAKTVLYVDGKIADENTSAPFDEFEWDLSAYEQNGEHSLSVEAMDGIGLSRMSLGLPIKVTVLAPPNAFQTFLANNSGMIAAASIFALGLVLLGIIMVRSRVRGQTAPERDAKRNKLNDPVTQPIKPIIEKPAPRNSSNAGMGWMSRARGTNAPAYLEHLDAQNKPILSEENISLMGREVTFGADPLQSTHVIKHLSVADLHARLRLDDKGNFILYDHNSIAGTWVNYNLIGREGHTLKHGDIIHFGKMMYRFMLRKAPTTLEPRIVIQK